MTDEGPSLEDMQRFGGNTGYCPDCGAEIWDQAEFCPECRTPLGGHTSSRPPEAREIQNRIIIVIAVIALVAFVLLFVF